MMLSVEQLSAMGCCQFAFQTGSILKFEKVRMQAVLPVDYWVWCDIKDVFKYPDRIPVGSVEFIKEYAKVHNITMPDDITYPVSLQQYLDRTILPVYFGEVPNYFFVKPIETKLFNGCIKEKLKELVPYDTPVWACAPVVYSFEYRFYVLDKVILGWGRYDDLNEDDKASLGVMEWKAAEQFVQQIINSYSDAPGGYAIDIGYCSGRWNLVEINDGWSLGFYPDGTLAIEDYIKLLVRRWQQILRIGPELRAYDSRCEELWGACDQLDLYKESLQKITNDYALHKDKYQLASALASWSSTLSQFTLSLYHSIE